MTSTSVLPLIRKRACWIVKNVSLSVIVVLTGACAHKLPSRVWSAANMVDEFTDQPSCRVLPYGAASMNYLMNPRAARAYPYVERRSDGLRVGLISGGGIRLPTGTVQFRVDDNEAWTITTSETPVDMAAVTAKDLTQRMSYAAPPGLTPQNEQAISRSANATSAMVNQSLSPFTASTGEKASQILNQMKNGREMIYRQVGANAASSTTGRIALGQDFLEALKPCGL